jgi:hypothetical protein
MDNRWIMRLGLLVLMFSACVVSPAMAAGFQYYDDFTTLNSTLWTMSYSGSANATWKEATINGTTQQFIFMQNAPSSDTGKLTGSANLKFNIPIQGNFSTSITYNLYTWPTPNNYESVGLRTEVGSVERVSNSTYGTQSELYLTDFAGDSIASLATGNMSGRLRLIRNGTLLEGCWYDETNSTNHWQLINYFNGVAADDVNITFSIWPAGGNQTVRVVLDDFNLHAYDMSDPRVIPEPVSMLLFGAGAGALALARRKMWK